MFQSRGQCQKSDRQTSKETNFREQRRTNSEILGRRQTHLDKQGVSQEGCCSLDKGSREATCIRAPPPAPPPLRVTSGLHSLGLSDPEPCAVKGQASCAHPPSPAQCSPPCCRHEVGMSLRHLIYCLEHLETPAGLPVKAARLEVERDAGLRPGAGPSPTAGFLRSVFCSNLLLRF